MPEVFVSYRPDVDLGGGFNWRLLNFGYNHQSNGRTDVLSRSWDRLFATFGVERENLALYGTVWYRLPENSSQDDNPDITDYYGYGELTGLYLRALLGAVRTAAPGKIAGIDAFKQTLLGWPLIPRWTGDYQSHQGLMHAVSGAFGMARETGEEVFRDFPPGLQFLWHLLTPFGREDTARRG